jgi:hypothetical protein
LAVLAANGGSPRPLRMTCWRSSRAYPSIWRILTEVAARRCTSPCQESGRCRSGRLIRHAHDDSGCRLGGMQAAGGGRRKWLFRVRITADRWAAKSLSHNSRRKIPIQMLRLLSHAVQHALGRQKEWAAFPMRRAPSACYALAYSAGCREAGFLVTSRMHSGGLGPA